MDDEDYWADYMISKMTNGEVTNISDTRIDDKRLTEALTRLRCPQCGGSRWVLLRDAMGPERLGVFDAEIGDFRRVGDEIADLLIVCHDCNYRWRGDDYESRKQTSLSSRSRG